MLGTFTMKILMPVPIEAEYFLVKFREHLLVPSAQSKDSVKLSVPPISLAVNSTSLAEVFAGTGKRGST